MPAPKTPDKLRNAGRLRKLECFEPGCQTIMYASRANIAVQVARHGAGPRCACGSELYLSDPADCADVQSHLIDSHPLVMDDMIRERQRHEREAAADRTAQAWGSQCDGHNECAGCGWRRPPRADPDHWYCAQCQGVNDHGRWARCKPGSVEHERAVGLMADAPERRPVERVRYPRNRTIQLAAARDPRGKQAEPVTTTDLPF